LPIFVAVQFPIADGRVFAAGASLVTRPNWAAPQIRSLRPYGDFLRGFGRLAYRRRETDADWIDEDFFAYARRALRFPTLERRHLRTPDGELAMVSCRFRRLLSDGNGTVRLEVGFRLVPDETPVEWAVREVLRLPTVVPVDGSAPPAKELVLVGPQLARLYGRALTPRYAAPAVGLVAAGDPIVVVETSRWDRLGHPADSVDASAAVPRYPRSVSMTATRTPHGRVETWYIDLPPRNAGRNLRLVLLRQHAQEEALDHILRWTTTGALRYTPHTEQGDRLDRYINDATRIIQRDNDRGIACGPLRDALDAVTATRRHTITARREAQLDGMRRQVREKAERFLAEREARRPTFNVYGTVTMPEMHFNGTFYGPVANTVYAETLHDSFNTFAASGPDPQVSELVGQLHQQVAALVARLKDFSPEQAADVTGTVATFTEEVTKKSPNKITLRALGQGIAEAARQAADIAGPIITTVTAVLKLFGITVR
jgi:hypothetical protein